jgi:hydrogenase nickel incorporation protein HypA/HybF
LNMHEIGIANSILEALSAELRLHPDVRAKRVGVRIGELSAIDEDALRFCFEALARDIGLADVKLHVELCPRRHRCRSCGSDFTVRAYDFQCPQCRLVSTECVSGDELELAYLEVEEHEPSAAATKSS